jgi:hypothetical protein
MLSEIAKGELLARGMRGEAIILRVRGDEFGILIQLDDRRGWEPYAAKVRDRFTDSERARMRPGDLVECRVDPGDRDRILLRPPEPTVDPGKLSGAGLLTDGRRASATVLAATATGRHTPDGSPILRLDLELTARDEPAPWRVRTEQPVPMTAVPMMELGRRLTVAFFSVDDGESVTVDWPR